MKFLKSNPLRLLAVYALVHVLVTALMLLGRHNDYEIAVCSFHYLLLGILICTLLVPLVNYHWAKEYWMVLAIFVVPGFIYFLVSLV